jgi:hypothetical protein
VTEIWRFDFTSPAGGGYYEVDANSFVIPVSAGAPTNFTILAADVAINAGGLLGPTHYTQNNIFQTSCAPAECSLTFSIPKTHRFVRAAGHDFFGGYTFTPPINVIKAVSYALADRWWARRTMRLCPPYAR